MAMASKRCTGPDRSRSRRPRFAFVLLLMVMPAAGQPAGGNTTSSGAAVAHEETPESLFVNFLHYARLGRFTTADGYAKALLEHPDLDPVAIMEVASRDPDAINTIQILIRNSTIGDRARQVLELIERGQFEKRKDPELIRRNIEGLGGTPQQRFFAVRHLIESGEYAIPQMLQVLQNPAREALRPHIIRALPKIGKAALNPLLSALSIRDDALRLGIIEALGEIGYPQAIPYLRKVIRDSKMPAESKTAAQDAISRIENFNGRQYPGSAEEHFVRLAEKYYNEDPVVRADPRLDEANVWYWDDSDQVLARVAVATRIFGPIMAMRCGGEALILRNNHPEATALWLAANIRREARLGLDVESGEPVDQTELDPTRKPNFPRALYFAQAAGPMYDHAVVARAVADGDSAVALGAIAALAVTAGESSLIGSEDYKQPLVQALQFPDLLVRIRAALALGGALPQTPFNGSDLVIPVLSQALAVSGREQVLVVDPDGENLNRVMSALRTADREVVGAGDFDRGLDRARTEFQTVSGIYLASDVADPGLAAAVVRLRGEFTFSKTPVVILEKRGQAKLVDDTVRGDPSIERVISAADDADLVAALERANEDTGKRAITPEVAQGLALQAGETLRRIAVDGRTVYDIQGAEPALIAALSSDDERLQTLCASVLALLATPTAQRAVAHVAMDGGRSDSLRIAAFSALARSAQRFGNMLEDNQVSTLVGIARDEQDLTLRTAASEALGAANLASNQASEIIRSYYGG